MTARATNTMSLPAKKKHKKSPNPILLLVASYEIANNKFVGNMTMGPAMTLVRVTHKTC